ncbi:MAG: DUF4437 domain-containing protein [Gammaproteobacteria bacterium]|nr:DUF4437 domain-containing protein [Gammaproteobacteria bacterium]MBT8133717.1 DUF4437 domain-containing protein [Gammaproteobacteria bacterium]NNJ50553.1 DUF4437 domain-containing protein [Gammaproteobacteria bacterium]
MRTLLSLALASVVTAACASQQSASDNTATKLSAEPGFEVVAVSEVKWQQLNPARGDKSPQAGTLWGDRKAEVPTGFLAKFVDGFSSPPHIHNATYRAVVISGGIHNDDPDAADMWMPAGSFWTQPKGEVHITAARGNNNVALVEIDKGPYLVLPTTEAFDSGERPVNVDASNIVWVDPPGVSSSANGVKLAYLWGKLDDGQSNGTFIKLPAGFSGKIHSHGSVFRAVVIKGQARRGTDDRTLDPGSYFGSEGETVHPISSKEGEEVIIYVRTDGSYDVVQD